MVLARRRAALAGTTVGFIVAAALTAAAAAQAPSASVRAEVEALRARRAWLFEGAPGRGERFAVESLGEASVQAEFEAYGARDENTVSAGAELRRRGRELEADEIVVAVESALISRRLEAYDKTGILPPASKDDGTLARSFEFGRSATPPVKPLESDLLALTRQLGLPPPPRRERKLPAPAAPPSIVLRRAPEPIFSARGRPVRRTNPLPALMSMLNAPEARSRALAADELAAIGPRAAAALPVLRRALSDGDPRVRASSTAALGAILSPDDPLVADLRRMLVDADEGVRLSAAAALNRFER